MKKIIVSALTVLCAALLLSGCKKTDSENEVLRIGASPTPHAEILMFAQPLLKEKGVNIKIVEMSDYIIPNMALDSGDLEANFSQHEPYLIDFNAKNKLKNKLVSAGRVHFEPLGIYAGKSNDLQNIKSGAIIGIPSDPTNGARALWLLDSLGIIKVKEGTGFEATELDIIENPTKIIIKPLEAAQLPASLPDMDFGIINGNYALGAGVSDRVLATESKDSASAKTFANIIGVRDGDINNPKIKTLAEVLQSSEVKKYIEDTYKGVVIPVD